MKEVLKNIRIAYYSIYVAAIAAAASGFYILRSGFNVDPQSEFGIALNSFLIIFIIGSVPITLALFNYGTKKWAKLDNTELKLKKYQQAAIIRLVVLGISLVLGTLFFYFFQPSTQAQSILFCAGIAAIGVFFCKPAESKIIAELNLEEKLD